MESPVVAARFEGADASRVVISAPHENLRIATHLYDNEAVLEKLARELRSLL